MSRKRLYYGMVLLLCFRGLAEPVRAKDRERVFGDSVEMVEEDRESFSGQAVRVIRENPVWHLLVWVASFLISGGITFLGLRAWSIQNKWPWMLLGSFVGANMGLTMSVLWSMHEDTDRIVEAEEAQAFLSTPAGGIPIGYLSTILDLMLLLLLLFFGYRGLRNGLVSQFFSTAATLLFIMFGKRIFTSTQALATSLWPGLDEAALPFAAFILMLLMGWAFVFLAERVLKYVLRETFMGYLDSLLGGFLGVVQATFCLSALIWLLELNEIMLPASYSENMRVYQFVAMWMPKCVALLKTYLPKQAALILP